MELREYFKILLGKWWLIIPLTLMGFTYSLVFSYSQTPTYEAVSTYITGIGTDITSQGVDLSLYASDIGLGRERIYITYCEVLISQTVRDKAFALLAIDPTKVNSDDYKVTCSNLPDTQALSLTVTGPSPVLVERLNEAIGQAGITHTNAESTLFQLAFLDHAIRTPDPIAPKYLQNGVLGGALGLVIGVTLALMIEYLQSPLQRLEALSIRHPLFGIYNERYFRQRFEQELNRAQARNRPISLSLLNLIPNEDFALLPEETQNTLYRSAALKIEDSMRQGDIAAYMGHRTFGILLAETPASEAQDVLEALHAKIRTHTFDSGSYLTSFVANSGLVASSGGILGYQEMLNKAAEALKTANGTGENIIHLIRATTPFVLGDDMDVEDDNTIAAFKGGGSSPFDTGEWNRVRPTDSDTDDPALRSEKAEVIVTEDSANKKKASSRSRKATVENGQAPVAESSTPVSSDDPASEKPPSDRPPISQTDIPVVGKSIFKRLLENQEKTPSSEGES
jgi:diguanylate cyclase (GGDEF)-like protein